MSSRVVVANRSSLRFRSSVVLFSEIEESVEKFWESKISNSRTLGQESFVFGKLIHPDDLPASANFVVSIILSVENGNETEIKENLIILKSRIKGSKTGSKMYTYASSFPETIQITKPQWHKGNSKNYFLTKFLNETMQVTCDISWNDNITFVIEQLEEEPIICRLIKPLDKEIIVDFYENQWKSKTPGHTKYTHSPISIHNHRPQYSTFNGDHVLPKSTIMPPSPLWIWLDDWHLDCSLNPENGWIYLDDWKSSIQKTENSTKFRFRRWIRTRILKKNIAELNSNNLNFISNHFNLIVNSLEKTFPPFLRELEREVSSNISDFDFSTIAAIPSPRLRRELKIYSI